VPRQSKRARWRAATLTAVYFAFAAHALHGYLTGRTLGPVEPSEAMQTLEQGLLNAGFVFFALAILSTLVLGRWFCGWGCHVVALQDGCTWMLRKVGIRPAPPRSRLLLLVPLLAALYMFVWPTVRRMWRSQPPPPLIAHFLTYDFWARFPGIWVSLLTFVVCGAAAVVLLGNKGFCTYACPYGGFFGLADLVAPGRIRVTDACDGCGHCTAACTSNVRVHEEVRLYGMVVNPGCMKTTDCISVCPHHALYFGFGRPTLAKGRPRLRAGDRKRDYSWREELALALLFLCALYAFYGLYDAVPFLLALGVSSIAAFLLLTGARLLWTSGVQWRGVPLRVQGRLTRSGRFFLALMLLLAAFVTHCVLVQYHVREGERLLARAEALQRSGAAAGQPAIVRAARSSLAHLLWAHRHGFWLTPKCEAQLGSLCLFLGDPDQARQYLARALALAPTYAAARYKLAELLAHSQDLPAAVDQLARAVHDNPALAEARRDLIAAARRIGRLPAQVDLLADVVRRRPYDAAARLDLAIVLAETGDLERGVTEVRRVIERWPNLPDAHFRLGLLLAETGDVAAAIAACERAVLLDPNSADKRHVLGRLESQASRREQALAQLDEAKRLAPLDPEILRTWAKELVRSGQAAAVIAAGERAGPDDVATHYSLAFLYEAAGQPAAAADAYRQALARRPDLPPP
jgi:tetratricopeptide (TPR) repeat protein/NAD-dependent dihydropyrimidine dehydrogenase PreA subunit